MARPGPNQPLDAPRDQSATDGRASSAKALGISMSQDSVTAASEENTQQRIVRLLHAYIGESAAIGPETQLLRDLQLWGDDADNFFDEFIQQFGVDMCGAKFGDYFPEEGKHVGFAIQRLLTRRRMHDHFRAITVADLANSAALGRWVLAATS